MFLVSKRRRVAVAVVAMLLAGGTLPALAQNQANAPAVVIQVRNVQELIDDARYLAETIGGPAGAGIFEGLLQQVAPQGKIPGVDETRPVGAVIGFGQFGEVQMPVFFVPIRDQDAFRKFLKQYFLQEQKLQDDLYFYQSPDQAIYAKFTERTCYLSLLPTALESPPNVAKLPAPKRDIELVIHLDRFPPEFLTALDAQLQIALAQAQAAAPEQPENETERLAGELGQKVVVQSMKTLLTEAAEIRVSLDVDRQNQKVLMAFSTSARPDTGLAALISSLGQTRSRYTAILSSEDFARVVCAVPLNEGVRNDLIHLLTQLEKDLAQDQEADVQRVKPLLHAVRQCLSKTTTIEFAAAARVVEGHPVFIVAGSLADPAAIQEGIVALAKSDPDLNVKVTDSQISIATGENEELAILFSDNSFYAAVGRSDVAAKLAQEARGAVEAAPSQALSRPFALVADAKRLIAFEAESGDTEEDRQQAQAMLDAIGDAPAQVAILAEVKNGVYELRFEVQEGVLKAIGVLASMAAAELEGFEVDSNVQ